MWEKQCSFFETIGLCCTRQAVLQRCIVGSITTFKCDEGNKKVHNNTYYNIDIFIHLINGISTVAIVDTSVARNFITIEEARRLGLVLENGKLYMKMMTLEEKSSHGVARDIAMKIES